jgi:SPP1 gp7 family putative phage head morphogenesis protein
LNKRQKEILQYQLDSEKAVLEQLTKHYQRALNDIDRKIRILESDELTQSRVYRIEYQKALKKQVAAVLEKLHADEYTTIQQFLSDSYTDAFIGNAYDMFGQGVPLILPIDKNAAVKAVITDSKISEGLYEALGVDTKKLKNSISSEITRGIAAGLPHSDIARNIASYAKAPLGRAKTIVRTESHRIQQASKLDSQKAAAKKGANVVKQWNSTLDGDTRPNHKRLDGQIREVDEPFEIGGMKAMYPGDFGDPAEDCNCRCQVLQRARIALDEDELKTLQDRAKFFGLDKSDDLDDFKKKYLKAAEKTEIVLENAGKNGIIKEKDTAKGIGIQYFAKMPEAKFTGYALNPEKDPDKAKAFKEALGYDLSNYAELMQNINDHIDESKFVEKGDNGHGMLYEYIMALEGPNGKTANVLTAWIQDGDEKRLTSVYVTEKKVTE